MSDLIDHLGVPEFILVAFVAIWVGVLGLPALLVAKARGRSRVAWFFLGIGISFALMGLYPLVLPSAPKLLGWLAILVAPAILVSIPKLAPKPDATQEPSVS